MSIQNKELKSAAHLTNTFAIHSRIGFTTARQLCLFLLLVAQTDPFNEEEELKGYIRLQDIADLIRKEGAKRSGSLHSEVLEFVKKMMENNYVEFKTEIKWRNQKLPRYISIFDELEPIQLDDNNTMYAYQFNEKMRPHLKGLVRDYVKIHIPKGIKSGHAVRFLIMAKAHHDRLKAYNKVTELKVTPDELKGILNIAGKYPLMTSFRNRVIIPIKEGVNKSKILEILDIEYLKVGTKISHIVFHLTDGILSKQSNKRLAGPVDYVPTTEDINKLTFAQHKSYLYLTKRFCKPGIVYRQIVQQVTSSEYLGWEDVFVQKAWERFERSTKYTQEQAKAGAFIKWWTNGEFKNRLFSEIMESVIEEKKKKSDIELNNRRIAKDISHLEFMEIHGK